MKYRIKRRKKKWYDGYKIGNTEGIYNPWSILNYLKNRELIPYWVNTSSNDLIKLILKNSATVKEKNRTTTKRRRNRSTNKLRNSNSRNRKKMKKISGVVIRNRVLKSNRGSRLSTRNI